MPNQLWILINNSFFLFLTTLMVHLEICQERFHNFRINILEFKGWVFAVRTENILPIFLNPSLAVDAENFVATSAFL